MTNDKQVTEHTVALCVANLVSTNLDGYRAANKLLKNTYGNRPGRPYSVENRDKLLSEFAIAKEEAMKWSAVLLSLITQSQAAEEQEQS